MNIKKLIYLIVIQFIFLPPLFSVKTAPIYDVAICAIFQNEAPYLKEWIEFHKLVGVSHFYLYNHLSNDHYQAVLQEYIQSGLVEVIDWPYPVSKKVGWSIIQEQAYLNALSRSRLQTKWLAIIDTDEFLFPVVVDTLSEFLKDYEDFGGVSVNWQMYGTSYIQKLQPDELMIERLILKAPYNYNENRHVKTILQPKLVNTIKDAHSVTFKYNFISVNSNKERVRGAKSSYVLVDKIRINHYWSRDEEFFHSVKVPRRQNWQDGGSYERLNNLNSEPDSAILKYVPSLKKAIFHGKT